MSDRKPFEFVPEDFEDAPISKESNGFLPSWDALTIAELANVKLKEWLDAAPIVHITKKEGILSIWNHFWPVGAHKVRLVYIEETKK